MVPATAKRIEAPLEPSVSNSGENKKMTYVFETYLRLRDGRKSSDNIQGTVALLNRYSETFDKKLKPINRFVALTSSVNCQRYLDLYNEVNNQQIIYLRQYLTDESIDNRTKSLIKARLEILNVFHEALFGLFMTGSEAGYSDLDKSKKQRCEIPNRKPWEQLVLQNYHRMNFAHQAAFGQVSYMTPVMMSGEISKIKQDKDFEHTETKIAFITAEVVASIAAWNRVVTPATENLLRWIRTTERISAKIRKSPWTPRAVRFFANVNYMITWVTFDRIARKKFEFLKSEPQLVDSNPLSTWSRLISNGEEFTQTKLDSPGVYFAHLKILDTLHRQQALDFLLENEWVLYEAEKKYGSIDAAYENLKEVEGL